MHPIFPTWKTTSLKFQSTAKTLQSALGCIWIKKNSREMEGQHPSKFLHATDFSITAELTVPIYPAA